MSASTLMEVFGHLVVSFTRGVTDHYNPKQTEFAVEGFGYHLLESTGREWYHYPVDELIYQEYSINEPTTRDYIASQPRFKFTDACSLPENEEADEHDEHKELEDESGAMAWKQLRPSLLVSVGKSMYIGSLISLLTAPFVGALYTLITYIFHKTAHDCEFQSGKQIPIQVQWMRTVSDIVFCVFLYVWFIASCPLLFRPFQLKGVKRKLVLICCLTYCLDALYRVSLQALGISFSKLSTALKIPFYVIFFTSVCWQVYYLTNHFKMPQQSIKRNLAFFFQMTAPNSFSFLLALIIASFIYPEYNAQNEDGKLLIGLFTPLIGVVLKVISRICVQRMWSTTHPGRSYVLLVPLYFNLAVIFRVLQADLHSVGFIAVLGIIHGAVEVVELSTMVVIDHICHVLWKRKSAPWGSFRTPRRERLLADIAIMSMLFE